MALVETLLQLIVIGGFLLYLYSKIKGQTIQETFEEIKLLIQQFKDG